MQNWSGVVQKQTITKFLDKLLTRAEELGKTIKRFSEQSTGNCNHIILSSFLFKSPENQNFLLLG